MQGTIPKRKVVDSRGTWCPPTPPADLFRAGDGFDVHAGHDAWTIGKDPFVFIDLITAAEALEEADAIRHSEMS